MAAGSDGVIYLTPQLPSIAGPAYPQRFPLLLRWSLAEQDFLPSVLLEREPQSLVRGADGAVYVAQPGYTGGSIRRLTRDEPPRLELFTTVPRGPGCLLQTGAWWFVCAGERRFSYGPDASWNAGEQAAWQPEAVAWDPARNRVIEFRRPTVSPDRRFLATVEVSPAGVLSGGPEIPAPGAEGPLLPSPDGAGLVVGRDLYDPESLTRIGSLGPEVVDSAWYGSLLLTLEYDRSYGDSHYHERSPDGEILRSVAVPGEALRIFPYEGGAVYVGRTWARTFLTRLHPGTGDLDGDSFADDADAFPVDGREWSDRDGDGVGDHGDAFPDDPRQSADRDGDGVGDTRDFRPDERSLGFAWVGGSQRVSLGRIPELDGGFEGQLHFMDGGRFALCTRADSCLLGSLHPIGTKGRKFELIPTPESLLALGAALRESVDSAVSNYLGRPLDLQLELVSRKARMRVEIGRRGDRARVRLSVPHRGRIPGEGPIRGVFSLAARGEWIEAAPP
jgi:hypothetical protein